MALCKYIRLHGVRSFSVCSHYLCHKQDLYVSYNHIEKPKKKLSPTMSKWGTDLEHMPWNEKMEIVKYSRRMRKKQTEEEFMDYRDALIMKFVRLRPILLNSGGIKKYFDRRLLETKLLRQSYIQDRVDLLGPDIAAAHFILNRGGRVKFWGHTDWITSENMKKLLPYKYAPGLYVLAIDATNTDLYYEGIDCLRYLNKLKWLRLKGLKNLNDFSLDIISGRYGAQLEYLDLTDCTGITHYGLEGFYRFKCLKGLNVTGIADSPEFHLTCFMIQDLLPNLDIIGIDFSQYLKKEDGEEVKEDNIQGQIHDKSFSEVAK